MSDKDFESFTKHTRARSKRLHTQRKKILAGVLKLRDEPKPTTDQMRDFILKRQQVFMKHGAGANDLASAIIHLERELAQSNRIRARLAESLQYMCDVEESCCTDPTEEKWEECRAALNQHNETI
jgi:hypothetical protein